jgi:hypothetical protein
MLGNSASLLHIYILPGLMYYYYYSSSYLNVVDCTHCNVPCPPLAPIRPRRLFSFLLLFCFKDVYIVIIAGLFQKLLQHASDDTTDSLVIFDYYCSNTS